MLKFWILVKIWKVGQNFEIWSKFGNLVNILKKLGDGGNLLGGGGDLLGDGVDLLGDGGNLLSEGGDLLGDGGNGRATRDWKSESVTNTHPLTYMGRC